MHTISRSHDIANGKKLRNEKRFENQPWAQSFTQSYAAELVHLPIHRLLDQSLAKTQNSLASQRFGAPVRLIKVEEGSPGDHISGPRCLWKKKKRIIFQFVAMGTTKDPLILLVEAEPRIILLPL